MRKLTVSLGETHNAKVTKVSVCTFEELCHGLLNRVAETEDKASNGWICGAEFKPKYRDSENFAARHLLSFDYDHIDPVDVDSILFTFGSVARLVYPTWSHTAEKPRLRVWLPLSRPCSYDEFQAVSRKVASWYDIEKMARESHTPAQYMFRPAHKPGQAEQFKALVEVDTQAPWIDVDEVLTSYTNWSDRNEWPHRSDGDGVHNHDAVGSPLFKLGVVGDFCRAFRISEAIERFELPYKPGSSPGRLTFTAGSRPDGAVVYDDDTKLHSHHDTDPARGQSNAFDLVRLHHFGWTDSGTDTAGGVTQLPSFRAMADFAEQQPEVRTQRALSEGFVDLDETDVSWLDLPDTGVDRPAGSGDGGPSKVPVTKPTAPERIAKPTTTTNDQENARRIQRKFGNKIIAVGGAFYFWQGTHWAKDESSVARCMTQLPKLVEIEAKHLVDEQRKRLGLTEADFYKLIDSEAAAADKELKEALDQHSRLKQWAHLCGQDSTQAAATRMLRKLLVFQGSKLNQLPQFLPVRNGVVDLRTSTLLPHDSGYYLTGCAPAPYIPSAEAPRFAQFLEEIYSGDRELIDFMQRWFGYCITAEVTEQKMLIHIGPGGNGKGKLMEALTNAVGEFSSTAAPGLLLRDNGMSKPSNDVADLMGRRMVTVSETDDGAVLRDGLVKQLTGGDMLKARFLYGENFEFWPTHKLQMFTNYEPTVNVQDRGMWRRLLYVPYPNRFGSEADIADGKADRLADIHLGSALKAEAPGILRWLIDGARAWYEAGLRVPGSIQRNTDKHQSEQDRVAQFLGERCVRDAKARIALSTGTESLYQAYKGWCMETGIHAMGRNRFSREVPRAAPGVRRDEWSEGDDNHRHKVVGFIGLKLEAE